METEFVRWSVPHWAALGLITAATVGFLCCGLRMAETGRYRLCRVLAVLILVSFLAEYTMRALLPEYGPWKENLPLQFCTLMELTAVVALWFRNRLFCAPVFFCVLTASIQALITPALAADWPSPVFFFFFFSHGLLMPAALAIPLLLGWRAGRWDPLRSVLLGDVYILLISPVNLLLDTNYGFTRFSPAGSMLDYLGPAPWYYLWLNLPALGIFSLMYLFVKERRRNA